jgi:hypothetical protein
MLHERETTMEDNENNSANNESVSQAADEKAPKKGWEPMKLTYVGEATDIVRSGGGKTGITQQDPGDTQKPPGLT